MCNEKLNCKCPEGKEHIHCGCNCHKAVATLESYDEIRARLDKENAKKPEKNFLVTICETYDGLEFYSNVIIKGRSAERLEYMSEKELEHYSHEDCESDVKVSRVVELSASDYKILKRLGI